MIFVDTNYFFRFLRDDIPKQSEAAKDLFLSAGERKVELFTSTVVFFEIYWVVKSIYGERKPEVLKTLQRFLKLDFIELAERDILTKSLDLFSESSIELDDCYNLTYAKANDMTEFATFDKKLSKLV